VATKGISNVQRPGFPKIWEVELSYWQRVPQFSAWEVDKNASQLQILLKLSEDSMTFASTFSHNSSLWWLCQLGLAKDWGFQRQEQTNHLKHQ